MLEILAENVRQKFRRTFWRDFTLRSLEKNVGRNLGEVLAGTFNSTEKFELFLAFFNKRGSTARVYFENKGNLDTKDLNLKITSLSTG